MRVLLLCIVWSVTACARDPIAECPALGTGELVLSEVRGDDDPANGPWIELFNASAGTLDLEGARIRFRVPDGSSEVPVIVRREVTVGAGGYIVLGAFSDAALPPHVDYGFLDDYDRTWLAAAAVDIETCGDEVDLARYDVLPEIGTYSLGAAPPDADANDVATMWCFDATPDGTPGAANNACP